MSIDADRLAQMAAQGMTDREMALEFGVRERTVMEHRHRLGIVSGRQQRDGHRRPFDVELFRGLLKQGLPKAEIARRTGYSQSWVYDQIRALALKDDPDALAYDPAPAEHGDRLFALAMDGRSFDRLVFRPGTAFVAPRPDSDRSLTGGSMWMAQ